MLKFENKVALITGAAGGIGLASALAFAKHGARIVVADIREKEGEKTVSLIKKAGGEATFISFDVTKSQSVKDAIDKILSVYGRLDFAHNNAGVECLRAPIAESDEEDWERTIQINLTGTWRCMKYEIPAILKQGKGAIVNTASVAGLVGLRKFGAYSASKHGIVGLTKTAALEYVKHGIRVNAVCPGLIETDMVGRNIIGDSQESGGITQLFGDFQKFLGLKRLSKGQPAGRLGTPEEVADAVVWLCSDEASYINGHALVIDGGFVVR